MTQDTMLYLIGLLLNEHHINNYNDLFRSEACRIGVLLTRGQTITQTLQTIEDPILREQLRAFLYPIRLRMVIMLAGELISQQEANELHAYVKSHASKHY